MENKFEINKGIYYIGANVSNTTGSNLYCNPFLLVDGEEGILIDPGSVLDFEFVYKNIITETSYIWDGWTNIEYKPRIKNSYSIIKEYFKSLDEVGSNGA